MFDLAPKDVPLKTGPFYLIVSISPAAPVGAGSRGTITGFAETAIRQLLYHGFLHSLVQTFPERPNVL